jgi:D-alanyl-D-alanine carboxypeptidase
MKIIHRKILAVVSCLFLTAGCFGSVSAAAQEVEWPTGPEVQAPAAIVMEASTGTVLYEKDADSLHYPASITKIMTTLLAIENCSMDEIVTFSEDAVYKNEGNTSHIWREVGEEMTMEQCLYAVMLESANECAYAVAEHVAEHARGGDYSTFIDMMNERAKELGCTNTNFVNCNGLPDENHVTTCRDMALISRAALQNSTFRQIAGTVRYTIPATNKRTEETYLNNHHGMISSYQTTKHLYEYAIGGKTGYTVAAGNTLVSFAEKDGMTLICVVMQCTGGTHYEDSQTLFEYCFNNFKMCNVAQNETRFENESESEGDLFVGGEAFATLDADAQVVLPVSADFSDTQTTVNYDSASDNVLGTLIYTYGGRQVGTADVMTTGAQVTPYEFTEGTVDNDEETADDDTVADNSLKTKISGIIQKIKSMDFNMGILIPILIVVAIAVVVIFVIWFLYNNIRRIWRRKQGRDRRYKTIKNNRKWNRRGGR